MLSAEQMRELATIVETGPDLETDEVVRWRRIDLCAVVRIALPELFLKLVPLPHWKRSRSGSGRGQT